MKKAIMVTCLIVVLSAFSVALADVGVITFCSEYGMWAETFGAKDIKMDIMSTEADEDGICSIGMDDVDIFYDAETWDAEYFVLWFFGRSGETDDEQQMIRLRAFIATLEYGSARSMSHDMKERAQQIISAKKTTIPIIDDFISCLTEYEDEIKKGKIKTFHISEKHLYQCIYNQSFGLLIFAY